MLKDFFKDFGLVGGTAVALHLGHRRSVDFYLFTEEVVKNQSILRKISEAVRLDATIVNKLDELTLVANGVKLTFFRYPYELAYPENFEQVFRMPDLLTLAAMKAFAMGQRSKWKDYVDLYFIIKDHYAVADIAEKSTRLFGHMFNEKLFRSQLAYFNDMEYREAVEFMPGFEVPDAVVKQALIEFSLA